MRSQEFVAPELQEQELNSELVMGRLRAHKVYVLEPQNEEYPLVVGFDKKDTDLLVEHGARVREVFLKDESFYLRIDQQNHIFLHGHGGYDTNGTAYDNI